jgi:type VI protein secretion system component Hcp
MGNRGVLVSAAVVLAAGVGFAGSVAAGASAAAPAPAAAPVAVALAAPGTVRGGIVLEGVAGAGTAIPGGIDVVDFSDVVKAPATAGGGGAGKPQVADLQVTGVVDAGYPALFRNVTTGRHLRTAALTACTDATRCAATAYLAIDLADAVVTHVAVDGEGQVQFALAFRQITWKFLRNGAVVSQSQFTL